MDRIYIALAAFLGGILIALAGWWDSHEAFDKRKFGASIIRSLCQQSQKRRRRRPVGPQTQAHPERGHTLIRLRGD